MRRGAILIAALVALAGCGGSDDEPKRAQPAPTSTAQPDRRGPAIKTVAEGLDVPWEIAFMPDGRALITERPGRVRLLSRDLRLDPDPVAEIDVQAEGEAGLLGLAIDPDFERNRFVYVYRTVSSGNEVARYRLVGDRLRDETVIVRGIQAGGIHDGGRLRFGPDGRLYFSAGETGQPELSQDRGSLNGKILRLDPSQYRGGGGRPEIFSLGHRNPQGFDWQPRTNRFVEDEHGPEGNDEINILRRGANYGWPEVQGSQKRDGFTPPVAFYPTSIAPSGATFVRRPGSEWTGDYLIGCLVGEQIRRVGFEGDKVTTNEPLFRGRFGRIRSVVEGSDGALYALTNNTDGRGTPRAGDDRVLRIVPPAG